MLGKLTLAFCVLWIVACPGHATYYEDQIVAILDKLSEGCYEFNQNSLDLPSLVSVGDPFMTADKCSALCREGAYKFAGLKSPASDAVECYCGNSAVRTAAEAASGQCEVICPGIWTQTCGGVNSLAVYHVNADSRYVGCFKDAVGDLDLPNFIGTVSHALECADNCMDRLFKFAGTQNGNQCYCGDTYGRHGGEEESKCWMSCGGYGGQRCGGHNLNSVYWAKPSYTFSMNQENKDLTKMYDTTGGLSGISSQTFTIYPGLKNLVAEKLVLSAYQTVMTPVEDPLCSADCYKDCGSLEYFGSLEETVIFRAFHFKMSEIHNIITNKPKRVFIYAQTVLVDSNVAVDYALQIRARQILLDRSLSENIETSTAETLGIKVEDIKDSGPHPDLMFMKQSYMCARILLDTKNQDNLNIAQSMLQEIVTSPPASAEQASFIGTVRAYITETTGINRMDVHFVPMYTKGHLSDALDLFSEKIDLYNSDLKKLEDIQTSNELFIDYAEDMNTIYLETDIHEATNAYKEAVLAVERANGTYNRMQFRYDEALEELDEGLVAFNEGIQDAKNAALRQALWSFVKISWGAFNGDYENNTFGLANEIVGVFTETGGMFGSLNEIARMISSIVSLVDQQNENMEAIENRLSDYDPSKYIEDIELTISMKESVVEWQNLKGFADIILYDPDVIGLGGARQFTLALMDTCNWGEAVSNSMTEMAENMRTAMSKRTTLDAKEHQFERVQAVINDMKNDHSLREKTFITMKEETMDVRIDLNEVLLYFCRAYFFETLEECSQSYQPSFGGDLDELLLKINAARLDDILVVDPPFTVNRYVTIEDEPTDGECDDAKLCPITYFRNNRILYYTVELDNSDLIGLEKYRVAELTVQVLGAKMTTDNEWLQVRIESSGDFESKAFGEDYTFITKAVYCPYEYSLINGDVNLYCDVYAPIRNVINHVTPYTTWVIYVYEPRSGDIDVSEVSEIRLTLRGAANIDAKLKTAHALEN